MRPRSRTGDGRLARQARRGAGVRRDGAGPRACGGVLRRADHAGEVGAGSALQSAGSRSPRQRDARDPARAGGGDRVLAGGSAARRRETLEQALREHEARRRSLAPRKQEAEGADSDWRQRWGASLAAASNAGGNGAKEERWRSWTWRPDSRTSRGAHAAGGPRLGIERDLSEFRAAVDAMVTRHAPELARSGEHDPPLELCEEVPEGAGDRQEPSRWTGSSRSRRPQRERETERKANAESRLAVCCGAPGSRTDALREPSGCPRSAHTWTRRSPSTRPASSRSAADCPLPRWRRSARAGCGTRCRYASTRSSMRTRRWSAGSATWPRHRQMVAGAIASRRHEGGDRGAEAQEHLARARRSPSATCVASRGCGRVAQQIEVTGSGTGPD